MPPVFGFIGGAITGWTTGAIAGAGIAGAYAAGMTFGATMLTGIVGKLLTTVAMTALQTALQKRSQQGGGLTISTTLRGEQNPETIILGRYATSGQAICPPYSHGKNNGLLTHVVELCSAPGATLERLIIGDDYVELGATPHPDGYGYPVLTPEKYANHIHVKYYDGSQTAADPMLRTAYGSHPDRPWTEDMVGHGICYAILTFTFNSKAGLTQVPRYRFEIGGIPLYDPRKDSTAGGSGSHRLDDPATWAPTVNPIVAAWNIFHGIPLPGGEIWGGQVETEDLPGPVWFAAMNACDAPEALSEGGSEPRYRFGLEASLGQEPAAVLTEILKACAGQVADNGGVWKVRVGGPALPVYTHSDDDVLVSRSQELDPFPSLSDTWNAVAAQYPDPEALWETRDAPLRTNATWEAADRFGRRTADLTLPAVPYKMQAQRLMRAWIEDERRFARHIFNLPPDATILEPLDTAAWSSQRNGYEAKSFEIAEIVEDVRSCIVQVSQREVDPTDYSWHPDFELPTIPVPTGTTPVPPAAVSGFAVSGLILTDGTGQSRRPALLLSWDSDLQAFGIAWEIRLAATGAVVLRGSTQGIEAGSVPVADGILPATAYQVRASLIVDRPAVWTGWLAVVSPDIRLTADELTAGLAGDLATLNDWIEGGAGDVPARLGDLAGEIAAEQAARAAELAALADDLAAEAAARLAEAEALAGDIAAVVDLVTEEAATRAVAVAGLADDLAAEQSERMAALAARAEEARRTLDRVRALSAEVLDLAASDLAAREAIRQSLTVTVEGMRASYDQQIVALADADLASVQRITTLEASSGALAAVIQQVEQARVEGDDALALLITSMAVGTVTQFDAAAIWYFDADTEGWTGANWSTGGYLAPTGALVSPSGLEIPAGIYAQVRLRVQKSATISWTGYLWWAASGQGWDTGRRIAIPEPVWSGEEGLITLSPGWVGEIDRIRLDVPTSDLLVDWLAVGRPAPGASSAELAALRRTVIDADEALAEDITQLQTGLTDAAGDMAGLAGAVDSLEARVTETEDGLVSASGALTALQSQVDNPVTGLAAMASALDGLETLVEAGEAGQTVAAQALRSLSSTLGALQAEAVEGLSRTLLADRGIREVVAEASQTLGARIDLTDAGLAVVAEEVTGLKAAVPGLASATALQGLTARVDVTETTVTSQSGQITSLQSGVDGVASGLAGVASAVDSLDTRVSETEDGLVSASGALTALQGQIDSPVTGLSALATALDSLETLVESGEAGQTVASQALRSLKSTLGALQAEAVEGLSRTLLADRGIREVVAGAAQVLETRIELTDAGLAVVAQEITSLKAAVPGLASATAIQALTSRVDVTEAEILAQAALLTSLQADLDGVSATLLTDYDTRATTAFAIAAALTALETEYFVPATGQVKASALNDYYTKSAADGAISTATTSLKSTMEGTGGSVKLAQDAAQAASDLAGGKGKVFFQTSAPAASERLAQNLWIDTTGGANTPKRWNGSAWVAVTDKVALDALDAAGDAYNLAETVAADLSVNYYTKVAADGAMAAALTALETEYFVPATGQVKASALNDYYTKSAADGAISTATTSLKSTMEGTGGSVKLAQDAAQAASDLAGGKGKVFFQTSAPAASERLAQNLWIDTTGGANTPKRWNGSAWIAVTDKVALDALDAAGEAYNLAENVAADLSVNYYTKVAADVAMASATTSLKSTMEGAGGSVKLAQDAAQAASDLAGGKGKVFFQTSAPAASERLAQNLWIDTTGGANTPKRWNGSAWVAVTDKVALDALDAAGDAYNLAENVAADLSVNYYTKVAAEVAMASATTSLQSTMEGAGGSVKLAQDAAQAASDLAGGKGKVFFQTSAPAASERLAQNLWIDTTGGANTPKRWNGSAWVAVTDKIATDAAAAAAAAQGTADAAATAVSNLSTVVAGHGASLTAQADLLTALEVDVGRHSASGLFRVTTEATPDGALARIGLKAAASSGEGNGRSAALYLEAVTGNKSRIIAQADTFAIADSSGAAFPFVLDGGVVYIDQARIKDGTITSAKIGALAVGTLQLQDRAVTIPEYAINDSDTPVLITNTSGWVEVASITINRAGGVATMLQFNGQFDAVSGTTAYRFRMTRDGTAFGSTWDHHAGLRQNITLMSMDPDTGSGPTIYRIEAVLIIPQQGRVYQTYVSAHQFKR